MKEKSPTNEIYSNLTKIICQVIDNESAVITPSAAAADIIGWDSIAHVRIILQVEEEFLIRFEPDEIARFKNVGEFVDLIGAKMAEAQ